VLLLEDIKIDLGYEFNKLDDSLLEHEIFNRPWDFIRQLLLMIILNQRL
jgi:hypothetical protein